MNFYALKVETLHVLQVGTNFDGRFLDSPEMAQDVMALAQGPLLGQLCATISLGLDAPLRGSHTEPHCQDSQCELPY